MFARVHVLQTTPEQSEAGLQIFQEQLLPWPRDASGYRGLIRLVDKRRVRPDLVDVFCTQPEGAGGDLELVPGSDLAARLDGKAVHMHAPALNRLGRKPTRLEQPSGPEPLIDPHQPPARRGV